MGYLAEQDNFEPKTLKEALAYGTLAASFTVEDFSLDRLRKIGREDLDRRMEEYKTDVEFLRSGIEIGWSVTMTIVAILTSNP